MTPPDTTSGHTPVTQDQLSENERYYLELANAQQNAEAAQERKDQQEEDRVERDATCNPRSRL